MKKIITTLTLFFSLAASCQIKVIQPDINNLPKTLAFEGKIKNALQWKDKSGDNIIIISETGEHESKIEKTADYRDAELFAYHFLSEGGAYKQTWKAFDFIKACPVDIEAKFIKNTLQITDLNNNGIGEIWLMYKTVCHGDVSPCNMKIIMYEGSQKYAMRGRNKVEYAPNKFEGGEYTFDKVFTSGPSSFRSNAISLWNKNIMQIWE